VVVESNGVVKLYLVIGSDHAGYALKEHLKPIIAGWGYEVRDVGCYCEEPVDYPDIAEQVVLGIKDGQAELGLLVGPVREWLSRRIRCPGYGLRYAMTNSQPGRPVNIMMQPYWQ
jgi:hypothetical protein